MKRILAIGAVLFVVAGCAGFWGVAKDGSEKASDVCKSDIWKDAAVQGYAVKAGINLDDLVNELCAVNEVVRKYELLDVLQARIEAVKAAKGAGLLQEGAK